MKQRPAGRASSSEKIISDIKRKTRKQCSAEAKIRIVLDGLRCEDSREDLVDLYRANPDFDLLRKIDPTWA